MIYIYYDTLYNVQSFSRSYRLHSIRGDALTDEEAKLAAILGWCIEWVRIY